MRADELLLQVRHLGDGSNLGHSTFSKGITIQESSTSLHLLKHAS